MRDVDFLPEWYKENTRRKASVQRQYIALSIIFLIMIFSNSVATRKISQANADLTVTDQERGQAERFMAEYERLRSRVDETRNVLNSAQRLRTKMDVARLLAELSTVVSSDVVLQSVRLTREPSALGASSDANHPDTYGVKVVGYAKHADHVANLIAELERSPRFHDVNLVYSKASTVADPPHPLLNAPMEKDLRGATLEFEVSCRVPGSVDEETD